MQRRCRLAMQRLAACLQHVDWPRPLHASQLACWTRRISARILMVSGLLLAALLMFALANTTSSSMLALILIGDGIAYGIFLTAGQSHIHRARIRRGSGQCSGYLHNGRQHWRCGRTDCNGVCRRVVWISHGLSACIRSDLANGYSVIRG